MASAARNKGSRNVRKAMNYLESKGWLVGKCELGGKFTKIKDLFGLFDISCRKRNMTLDVQITSNVPHSHKKYKEFAQSYAGPNYIVQQLVWMDNRGFKSYIYLDDGKRLDEDLFEETRNISDKRPVIKEDIDDKAT